MTLEPEQVKLGLPQQVPMVATLNLAFGELTPERAVMILPDQPAYRNHVGGPHAGAMFTLAESASGALILLNFGHLLDRAIPLAVSAEIRYLRLAMGEVTASATSDRTAADVIAELDSGARPELTIDVSLTAGGRETGRMSIRWTLKPVSTTQAK